MLTITRSVPMRRADHFFGSGRGHLPLTFRRRFQRGRLRSTVRVMVQTVVRRRWRGRGFSAAFKTTAGVSFAGAGETTDLFPVVK